MAEQGTIGAIKNNYSQIIEQISEAAKSVGRTPHEIRFVVVTKTQPIEAIREVITAGATDLGENYTSEAIPKIVQIKDQVINWHMLGHLQSRKAQDVCQYFQYLHSLDSLKLAERINRFALESGNKFPVWLEFNVGGEVSKSGWKIELEGRWTTLLPEIEQVMCLSNIEPLGVMAIPPYSENPEHSRPYFQKLRIFSEFVRAQFQLSGFSELSMGMSADYKIAIQEGSTCVRIGQAIFGPRQGRA